MSEITPKSTGNIITSVSGSTPIIHIATNNRKWIGLSIINDSASVVTFALNGIRINVNSNETFDDNFEAFDSIEIFTSVAYRLVLRG